MTKKKQPPRPLPGAPRAHPAEPGRAPQRTPEPPPVTAAAAPQPVQAPVPQPVPPPLPEPPLLPCGCLAPPPGSGAPGSAGGPPHDHGRRRPPAAVLAALAGVGVLVLGAVLLLRGQDGSPQASGPGPDLSVPGEDPPAVVAEPGSYARSRILDDGEIRVSQWIRGASALSGVDLRLPAHPPRDGARATKVVVTAGGLRVPGSASIGATPQHYEFPEAAELVHVTYSLTGAVVRSPSVPGRALAEVTALTADVAGGPSRVDLVGDVTSAACSTPGSAPRPCGGPDAGRAWRVVLRGADRAATVQAQVDLG